MSSWYTNIISTTSTRLNKVFASEADGDTEDDTHVCRVLRAYYTENGRGFPAWLPPDPKAPPPPPPQAARPQNGVGSRYGNAQGGQPGGQASGLSSLWDSNPQQQGGAPQSLRQGRGAPAAAAAAAPNTRNPFARGATAPAVDTVQARPLPSQRAGSYQTAYDGNGSTPPGSAGMGGGSAQDRLKQRLWGGARSASPASSGPFQPPPAAPAQRRSGQAGGSGGGDYEDRFAPGGQYDGGRASGDGGGGGGGGGRAGGLPSGPRRMGGLPSGPRMR